MWKLIFLSVCLLLAIPCQARIITVDDDKAADFNNIQAAINDSNDGDTIIVADGTYTGNGNRDIDFGGRVITVRSENGPNNCIIDCEGTYSDNHRGFYFHSGENANSVLAGFTITNGYGSGGGIYCDESDPLIKNCIITGNAAIMGGGIRCDSSSSIITNCVISGNFADIEGGGIACYVSGVSVNNCIITGNQASMGAATFNQAGTLNINNCTISGNKADGGGAVFCWYPMTISNSILWADTASTGQGDEIYSAGGSSKTGYYITAHYSIIQGGLAGVYGDVESWGPGIIDEDPCFTNPGYWNDNGTPTDTNDDFWIDGDYHLLSGSPCIDTGDPYYVAEPNETDLDGDLRVIDGRVDMGADEFYNGCFPSTHSDYSEWVNVGMPDCWCYPRQCHGDAFGDMGGSSKTGYYAVGPTDLSGGLVANWLVKEPPFGPGIGSGICADFAHDLGGSPKTGYYRVGPTDLNILIANWLVLEPDRGPGVPPDCLDVP
ncbi:MAG: choice-of-anchor Q domain-containing protein [Planctomycetota bacterium]|jgi:hypothetical protein